MRPKNSENKKKVLVAMSGGVDSSVAAALILKQGYSPIGVHLKFWADTDVENKNKHLAYRENNCCSIESAEDARIVANKLGIPFYVVDCRDFFKENIVDYFISSFNGNTTPNPCVMCNRRIKFGFLHDKMKEFGAEFIASGHYAQIADTKNNEKIIFRGVDLNKDQSYFLYNINAEYINSILYPVGSLEKSYVREIADQLGLRTAKKHDSQELCFVGGKDHREFLQKWSRDKIIPGNIVTTNDQIIGQHNGLVYYTIGQRKGIQTKIPRPWYVVKKDTKNNNLIVGDIRDTAVRKIYVENINIIAPRKYFSNMSVQLRYKSTPLKVKNFEIFNNKGIIELEESAFAVSNGQSAVVYSDKILLGGGIISNSE